MSNGRLSRDQRGHRADSAVDANASAEEGCVGASQVCSCRLLTMTVDWVSGVCLNEDSWRSGDDGCDWGVRREVRHCSGALIFGFPATSPNLAATIGTSLLQPLTRSHHSHISHCCHTHFERLKMANLPCHSFRKHERATQSFVPITIPTICALRAATRLLIPLVHRVGTQAQECVKTRMIFRLIHVGVGRCRSDREIL